ncbi:sigma-70 family RNA polymerase sigma factor [Rhodoplanes sp. TEM]|uniref:RNA polymerase sigma factor n=1 Tax=Rhodoplanes tepidamans TaxID=200616 RepID=A0ABT5J6J1_RHOTP|nr:MULTISPECIES: sigma-70 family RNA polymerase sigma factor [Rhodoplanes]MDC7785265.1 sigma-70 family RNA polymerase sigma factor [Rhodoplanes tepidamans]MDC7984668.1 sigma-70 family RNA polymerase sigma factor [Rhodoplanes sp. TEM]MDQ0353523.1 RNA polymerase sigma-70 factor (ECF subfamily) [Rhodoplanes tepidamans]
MRWKNVEVSDDDLIRRIAADDEAAFRMLVGRHVDQAYALALRILRNAADAEDVVQDTFLKIWTSRHRFEPGRAKFSTFLCRVVINRCIDFHRRQRTEPLDGIAEPADPRPDVITTLQRAEVNEMLEEAVAALPERQRVAILLSYHEGLGNEEIATVMETTVFAIESLLKRARERLRAVLRHQEQDIRLSLPTD